MPSHGSQEISVRRFSSDGANGDGDGEGTDTSETVVVEEPLETRLDGVPIAVTMRTPGNDIELVVGFLLGEGVVASADAVATVAHCDENENVIEVSTRAGAPVQRPAPRNFYASSSCGVCGKASIDEVRLKLPDRVEDETRVSRRVLSALPDRLQAAQTLFRETGALHAAGLFDVDGNLLALREDVGRHNAVDKVVGGAALEGRWPLHGTVLMVSGRTGFEIAQKAALARIPVLAGISGSSSLAVELARECGMTLVSFVRGTSGVVCSAPERIT